MQNSLLKWGRFQISSWLFQQAYWGRIPIEGILLKKSVPVLYFQPNYQAYSSIISALIPNFECSRLAIGIVIRLFPLSI